MPPEVEDGMMTLEKSTELSVVDATYFIYQHRSPRSTYRPTYGDGSCDDRRVEGRQTVSARARMARLKRSYQRGLVDGQRGRQAARRQDQSARW